MDKLPNDTVNCVKVNCVVLGHDGNELHLLLTQGDQPGLPGMPVRAHEDLDAAASRVVAPYGLADLNLWQSKAMNSPQGVEPCVTVGYVALVRMHRRMAVPAGASWVPLAKVLDMELPVGHDAVIGAALKAVARRAAAAPAVLLELLPTRFTALQLRSLVEQVNGKSIDVRNFKKKMDQLAYVVPLDLYEQGVAHRAARYYRFDRIAYKKSRR